MNKLLRPWRDHSFQLLALALAIAAFALSAVIFLRAELEQRFSVSTAEALGGDLVLSSSRAPQAEQLAQLAALRVSQIIDFSSVLVHNDALLLVSARAVDSTYPLYGQIQLAKSRFANEHTQQHGPARGKVWVADQVIDRLDIAVGATLTVGNKPLEISAIIRQLPDQNAGFYSMNPRIVLNSADLEATGVMGPGTRIRQQTVVAANAETIDKLGLALAKNLRPDQSLETVDDAALRSMGPLRQLSLWANLAVLLISLLCGAAIYLATSQRVRRRAKLAGLLRSFGASRYQVMTRLLGWEFLAVLPAVVVGNALGIALMNITLAGGNSRAGTTLIPASPLEWLSALLAPLLLWLAFALPRLSALVRVPAIAVLRQRQQSSLLSTNIELLAALAAPVLLAGLLTDSLGELGRVLGLIAALGVLLPALLWPLIKGFDVASTRLPLAARLAIRRLSRRPALTLPLLVSLTLAMTVLTLAGQTGAQLLNDWRTRLPAQAPNHFVLNLFEPDMPAFEEWLTQHKAIAQPLYPVVRGRLSSINAVPVREAVTKESKSSQRHLNRDLVLTEARVLPASNRINSGQWHGPDNRHSTASAEGNSTLHSVSVEQEIADRLGLKLGDKLEFVTSQGLLKANISSLREVDWNSFEPNFYFIFASGELANEDITWITSFWLPEGDGARLAELLHELPHITLLDVKSLLDKAQDIIAQASQASALLGAVLMFSALLVLAAGLLGGQQQRGRDNALLRALGGKQALIKRILWIEFLCLSGSAALGATAISLLALYPLNERLFQQGMSLSPWQGLPLALALFVTLCGLLASRRALQQPALSLLRSAGE
ncbi:MAG: ABC transporter permease [Gammaproteobacteria bacterium]|nr:ABC transporter permease [Gammaproteobacteria bacterium]MBQ0840350.1 ABC transporter permease [Gammaproteobacteria bacterium]